MGTFFTNDQPNKAITILKTFQQFSICPYPLASGLAAIIRLCSFYEIFRIAPLIKNKLSSKTENDKLPPNVVN